MFTENNSEPVYRLPKSKTAKDKVLFVLNIVFTVISSAALLAGSWWYFTVQWGEKTWNNLQLSEMIYTLLMPLDGTDSDMIIGHIVSCVVPAVIITAILVTALIFTVVLNKRTIMHIVQIAALIIGIMFAVIATSYAWKVLDLSSYLSNQEEYGSFIDENYVDPANVSIEFPEEKRNLIYIFLESMENTFADEASGGAFTQNVIPELTALSLGNDNFAGNDTTLNGGYAMTGATWTIGAIFSQTTGLPLLLPVSNNSMNLQEEFFPGVTGLGDILKDAGYRQIFLLGSDATFGGRNLYFEQHGDFELRDYNYYVKNGTIPEDYFVWWGYEDKILFENAKNTLTELSSSDEPFNLTMLTVDTHFEDGYVCDLCKDEFSDQYSNVYACSSKQVSEFIDWVKEQPFYENTTIVLAGDHKTMDKDYCDNVSANYDRTIYYTIINSAVEPKLETKREYSTFDSYPTTLAALGATIPGDRLGLGVNLYSSEPTLYELYGESVFNQGLNEKSALMENLTAGIILESAHIEIGDYDSSTRTITVKAKDITLPEDSKGVAIYVWPGDDTNSQIRYDGTLTEDNEYTFTINFDDFGNQNGKYNIHLYSVNEHRNSFIMSSTVTVDDANPENVGITVADAEPMLLIGAFDYASGYAKIQLANVSSNIVDSSLAVWTNADQSDLHWYNFQIGDDGLYYVDVPVADFGEVGVTFNICAYGTDINGNLQTIAATSAVIE